MSSSANYRCGITPLNGSQFRVLLKGRGVNGLFSRTAFDSIAERRERDSPDGERRSVWKGADKSRQIVRRVLQGAGVFTRKLLLVALSLWLLFPSTSVRADPITEEVWYPTYSVYRIYRPHIIVYVHGYGGSEETFHFVPYLESAIKRDSTTVLYFLYDTGALRAHALSIGIIAQQLEQFLKQNVFDRREDADVTIVCHSTGCPIARSYIVNNPFDHRISKLILIGGASQGAYFAEELSRTKRGVANDMQINELKYGSVSLFFLQEKLHFLFRKAMKAEAGLGPASTCADPPYADNALRGTPFASYSFVVGREEDCAIRQELAKIGEKPTIRLPRTVAIIGTNGWSRSGSRKYSDLVVRMESAIGDCRFLEDAPRGLPRLGDFGFSDRCGDRFIIALPCDHTHFFDEPACLDTVVRTIDYVVQEGDQSGADERLNALIQSYKSATAGCDGADCLGDYFRDENIGALWVRLYVAGFPSERYPLSEVALRRDIDDFTISLVSAKNAQEGVKKAAPKWTFLDPGEFETATRISTLGVEKIVYFQYLLGPQDIRLEIFHRGEQVKLIEAVNHHLLNELSVRIHRAQSTMIDCIGDWNATKKAMQSYITCANLSE